MKTGVAVFKHKNMGAYAFGALCALKEMGMQPECAAVSPESALCGLLLQKGCTFDEGKEAYQYFALKENMRQKLWNGLLEKPDNGPRLVLCCGTRLYTGGGKEQNLFGKAFADLHDFAFLNLQGDEEEKKCSKEQLLWLLHSMGAERVVCIQGEEEFYQKSIGKSPAYTLIAAEPPAKTCGRALTDDLNEGFRQAMEHKNELLNAIYFAENH